MSEIEIERRQDQRFETLIPGIITLKTPPYLTNKPTDSQDALTVKGFHGVVRNICQAGLMFDANVECEKVKRDEKEFFIAIATARNGGYLSFRVNVAWIKDYESENGAKRCLVGLNFIPLYDQANEIGVILSQVQKGKVFHTNFLVERTVYFGDTNLEGNVYFVRFFEWQGAAREEFYLRIMPDAIGFLRSGTRIVTADARIQFKSQFVLFDRVTIEVSVRAIRTANIELLFLYRKKCTDELAAIGRQTLAFTNKEGELIPVPLEVVCSLEPYFNPFKEWKTYLEHLT